MLLILGTAGDPAFAGTDGKVIEGTGDLTLKGAQLTSTSSAVTLAANHDVNLIEQQLQQSRHDESTYSGGTLLSKVSSNSMNDVRRTQSVASTVSGDSIVLSAGNDLTVRGSNVTGKNDVSLYATNDVNIVAAEEKSSASNFAESKSSATGFGKLTGATAMFIDPYLGAALLTSKSAMQNADQTQTQVVGSSISGSNIDITSGRDTKVQGSIIVADANVDILAGRNLSVVSAQETQAQQAKSSSKTSGFIGSFWQPAIGTVKQTQDGKSDSVTQVGSQIASLGTNGSGNVTLQAGEHYTQTASGVLAPKGDIDISAKNVLINEAYDVNNAEQRSTYSKVALGGTVSVPLISAVQGIQGMADAAKNTGDSRMKALAGINAAMNAQSALDTAQAMSNGGSLSSGIKVSVSLGSSKSESSSTQTASTVVGSQVNAGGNVSIAATGGGADSNLTAIATDISAGNNVSLKADNQVTLAAAQSTVSEHSKNNASGASIGIGFAVGGQQNGFTLELAANKARGHADGTDLTAVNTHVQAGNTASIDSGGDTTLKGAVVAGQRVTADIGGKLAIESLQDSSRFDSKQESAGVGVSVCIPPFCYGSSSVSASYSKSNVNGDYLSVVEQSGIKAGDGGFDVKVKGSTDLKGGVIASTQAAIDQNRNSLVTATLTTSDIRNHDSYDASGISLGVTLSGKMGDQSTAKPGAQQQAANAPSNPSGSAGYADDSGKQDGITQSGISAGTIVITDEQGQKARTGQDATATVASINRNVTSGKDAGNTLVKQWNGQQLVDQTQAAMQITAAFGQSAAKAVGDYAGKQTESYVKARDAAQAAQAVLADSNATVEQKSQAQALLTAAQGVMAQQQETYDHWKEGGDYRVAAHTAIGALAGGAGGALGAGVSAATMPHIGEAIDKLGLSDPVKQAVGIATASVIGAAAGGTAGAVSGLNIDANNRQLTHTEMDRLKKLAGNDQVKEARLAAAACALVKCAAEFPVGSAEYRQMKALEDLGNSPTFAAERQLLSQQTDTVGNRDKVTYKLFQYGVANSLLDSATRVDNTYQVTTRVMGGVQAVGGAATAVAGAGVTAGGAVTCPETGVGCLVAAGGVVMTGYGIDQTKAGVGTMLTGQQQPTLGGQLIQQMLGVSPGTAELMYGLAGLTPAAVEATLANKAVNAQIAANAAARNSYAASSTALPEGYAPLKSVGAAANDTGGLPAGFQRVVNQATGDVQVLGSDGRIYNEVTQGGKDVLVPVAKGSPVDYDHIIGADYTKAGKPTGGHTLLNGDVKIVAGTESIPDATGVYKATIQIPDPQNPGQWITKTSNGSINTMFPKVWDEARIKAEVDAAWNSPSKIVIGDKWSSVTPSGVKVEGFISPRTTVYPVYQTPKKP